MNETIFHVGVKGILMHDDKALILQADSPSHGRYWDFPGGRVQEQESLQETLLREVTEEVPSLENISVGPLVHGARLTLLNDRDIGLVLFFFRISAAFTEIVLSEEHAGYQWLAKEDVSALEQDGSVRLTPETEGAALKAAFSL
ncbi:MAG: NUDIX hydrolase [Candidatus Andersenbacteria bacterium]